MNDVAKALPSGKLEVGTKAVMEEMWRTRPEAVALRHVHDFLLEKLPPGKRWGDLRPVRARSGDILWLCKEHAAIQQPPVQEI